MKCKPRIRHFEPRKFQCFSSQFALHGLRALEERFKTCRESCRERLEHCLKVISRQWFDVSLVLRTFLVKTCDLLESTHYPPNSDTYPVEANFLLRKRVGIYYLRLGLFYLHLIYVACRKLAWYILLIVAVRFGLSCLRWKIGLVFLLTVPPRPELDFEEEPRVKRPQW